MEGAGHNSNKLIEESLEIVWCGRPKPCFQILAVFRNSLTEEHAFTAVCVCWSRENLQTENETTVGCLGSSTACLVPYLCNVTRYSWSFLYLGQILEVSVCLFANLIKIFKIAWVVNQISPASADQNVTTFICSALPEEGDWGSQHLPAQLELPDLTETSCPPLKESGQALTSQHTPGVTSSFSLSLWFTKLSVLTVLQREALSIC